MEICIFGDSIAKGVVYDDTKRKYTHLGNCFANLFSQTARWTVKNYARFGCTVIKGAEILKKHQEDLTKFAYTVLEFGGNDCDLNWEEVAKSPGDLHFPKVPLDRFESCYSQMIQRVRESGSIPVLLSLPPLEAPRFFNWVSQGLSQENILKYLGDVQFIFRWHESYNQAIRQLAKKHGAYLIDIRDVFLDKGRYSDFLCGDGMHPNEKGHALIHCAIQKQVPQSLY